MRLRKNKVCKLNNGGLGKCSVFSTEALVSDAQHLSEPGMMGKPVTSVLLGTDRMIWGLPVQPG